MAYISILPLNIFYFFNTFSMRILIVSALALFLASCTATVPTKPTGTITPPTATTSGTTSVTTDTTTDILATTGSVVTLNYTLRADSETGPVQETTLQAVAQANGLNQTGAKYQPYQVVIGQNQVIYGFEKGLMGVKKGEKKTIKVIPSEGYGRPVLIGKEQIAPQFTLTRDRKMFDDVLTQTIEKAQFPAEMQAAVAAAQVGGTLTGANNAIAKVINVSSGSITLAIDNIGNPFYKKSIKVGATASGTGAEFKIVAIEGENVTFEVTNKESPFYGRNFAVGESVTPNNGSKITIQEIGDTSVAVLADHPFMAKDLYFEVEIVNVQ